MSDKNDDLPARGKLSADQAGLLLEQLNAGIANEVPLDEIFRALADDLTDRRLRSVANHLANQLQQGVDLETALDSIAQTLPAHLRRALATGAKSGNLAGILAGLSESELARKRMRRGLRQALAYPLLVFSALGLVLYGLSVTVFPQFAEIFDDFELDLPYVTLYTLKLSEYLPQLFLTFVSLLAIALCLRLFFFGSRLLHWIRTALPLMGRVWMWSGQHEFATLMATLTQQGIPLNEALACTADSLRDRNLAWASRHVSAKCDEGATLSQGLRDSIHFDSTLTSLVEWGEAHESLPAALREAANTYEKQMELYNRLLNRVLPPLMLTSVAITLMMSVFSMFIPLVELINGLTG